MYIKYVVRIQSYSCRNRHAFFEHRDILFFLNGIFNSCDSIDTGNYRSGVPFLRNAYNASDN